MNTLMAMKLISYPQKFCSVLTDNSFRFGDIDPEQATEIKFWLATDSTPLHLGTKRYVGQAEVAAQPATYLRGHLAPEPHYAPQCSFVYPTGRNLKVYVGWDNDTARSPKVVYTAAQTDLVAPAVVDRHYSHRQIGPGENDEVGFVVAADTMMTMAMKLPNGQVVSLNKSSGSQAGFWVLCVDISWVLEQLENPEEVESFDLELKIAGQLAATIHYDIVERPSTAFRLGWLTPEGTIAYHTFQTSMEERTEAQRTQVESATSGAVVVGVEGYVTHRLRSGTLAPEQFELLRTLVTSPVVWRIGPEGEWEQVALLEARAVSGGEAQAEVEVVVRDKCKQRYW